jgi:hypothetical protein
MRYQVYGLLLSSEMALPELASAAEARPEGWADLRVRFGQGGEAFPSPEYCLLTRTLPTGELWLSMAKNESGYLLRFPELADFSVDAEGREVVCLPVPETPPHTTRHLLLDQVLPLVLTIRGRKALHATAVLTPDGVCVFTAPTGTGKSTLAASLLLAGYPVLSDDCLVLEERDGQVLASPAYPGLRLWEDTLKALGTDSGDLPPVAHYTSKRRLVQDEHDSYFLPQSFPVAKIYVLVRPAEVGVDGGLVAPRLEHLSLRDGLVELLPSLFHFDVTDRTMLARQIDFLGRVVSHVTVRRLWVPNAFTALPAVHEVILQDLKDRSLFQREPVAR